MTIRVSYPHDARSMEPLPLKAQDLWIIADEVRSQVMPRRPTPCMDMARLVRAAQRCVINGQDIIAHWDLNRNIRDNRGRDALGVTEADPALPGSLLISLNAELIADRDYLRRSTLAHELGHALFDGPAMLRQLRRPAFSIVTANEDHLAASTGKAGRIDWREFRANEFMGALLAPRSLLHRELVRRAIALGLPLHNVDDDQPVLRRRADPIRVEELLFDLGERFGVSASFIEYRLHRYKLVQ